MITDQRFHIVAGEPSVPIEMFSIGGVEQARGISKIEGVRIADRKRTSVGKSVLGVVAYGAVYGAVSREAAVEK